MLQPSSAAATPLPVPKNRSPLNLRQHRALMLTTAALLGSLVLGLPDGARAQSFGGDGGGNQGSGGTPTSPDGQPGDAGTNSGGGGGAANGFGALGGGFGGEGGDGGLDGTPGASQGNFGGVGNEGRYDTTNGSGQVGGGGGGAGGNGLITGLGTLGDTANIPQGGRGGDGGYGILNFNGDFGGGESSGGASYLYFGGGGGDGGAGLVVSPPATSGDTVTANVSLFGGNGGYGGAARLTAYGQFFYGRPFSPSAKSSATAYGGQGGDGGSGAFVQTGGHLIINSQVVGGYGGQGGDASTTISNGYGTFGFQNASAYGGNGGRGGNGITVIGGGTVDNFGNVQGGTGGVGGSANTSNSTGYGGSGGAGGDGLYARKGATINNHLTIIGGSGGAGGSDGFFNGEGAGGQAGNGIRGTALTIHNFDNAGHTTLILGGNGGPTIGTSTLAPNGGAGVLVVGNEEGTRSSITNDANAVIQGGTGGSITFKGGGARQENLEVTFAGALAVAPVPGQAGNGGPGISATATDIENQGTILGGNPGSVFNFDFDRASAQDTAFDPNAVGGIGIVGSDLYIRNAGYISGGPQQTTAIQFTNGVNTLILEPPIDPTHYIEGNVIAFSTADTFGLGGQGAATLDTSQIGAAGSGAKYSGFGVFEKIDPSTWTLTNTTNNGYVTEWNILEGTLAISQDQNLGGPSGRVIIDGGVLETTATFGSDRQILIGSNGGTSNVDSGTTFTLGGIVADASLPPGATAGQFIKIGDGTLVLLAANTYSGGTDLKAGEIIVGQPGSLGSGPLSMDSGTTLGFLISLTFGNAVVFTGVADPTFDTMGNTVTMSGVISGGDKLTKAGAGTLTLTGVNTYTGGTEVAAGTLSGSATSFGTGPLAVDTGATLNLNQATNSSFANSIADGVGAPGTVTKTGAGVLDLTGTSTYTGPTSLLGGVLLVDGSIVSSVTASAGTTLGGSGTIGGFTALSGATIQPGYTTPYSTLKVSGNGTFDPGSSYNVTITSPNKSDLISLTGTIAINGGTVNATAAPGSVFAVNQVYTIITSAGITGKGTFDASNFKGDYAFLTPFLAYTATDVQIRFQQNAVTFPTVAKTPNQKASASGIQGLGAGNPLYNAVLGQTVLGALQAFDAASGEIHADVLTAGIEDQRFPRESIMNRLDDTARPGGGSAVGAVGGYGALAPVLPPGAQGYAPVHKGYDMPAPVYAPPPPAYTAWGTGFGDFGTNDGNHNAAGFDRTLGGFVLGVDTRVDWANFSNWRIGVAGGYMSDDIRAKRRNSSGTFETYYGGLYAGAQYGAIDIKLGALGGGTETTTSKGVLFPGFVDLNRASYGGTMAQGFGELGYKIGMSWGFIEPFFQGAAVHLGQDSFNENGGVAALHGFARDIDVQFTTLGLKAETAVPVAGLPMIARAFLGWRHAFGDVDPRVLLAFQGGGPSFLIAGAPISEDAVYAQFGLDYRASANLTIGLNYSGQYGDTSHDNAVKGTMQYRF